MQNMQPQGWPDSLPYTAKSRSGSNAASSSALVSSDLAFCHAEGHQPAPSSKERSPDHVASMSREYTGWSGQLLTRRTHHCPSMLAACGKHPWPVAFQTTRVFRSRSRSGISSVCAARALPGLERCSTCVGCLAGHVWMAAEQVLGDRLERIDHLDDAGCAAVTLRCSTASHALWGSTAQSPARRRACLVAFRRTAQRPAAGAER